MENYIHMCFECDTGGTFHRGLSALCNFFIKADIEYRNNNEAHLKLSIFYTVLVTARFLNPFLTRLCLAFS